MPQKTAPLNFANSTHVPFSCSCSIIVFLVNVHLKTNFYNWSTVTVFIFLIDYLILKDINKPDFDFIKRGKYTYKILRCKHSFCSFISKVN